MYHFPYLCTGYAEVWKTLPARLRGWSLFLICCLTLCDLCKHFQKLFLQGEQICWGSEQMA